MSNGGGELLRLESEIVGVRLSPLGAGGGAERRREHQRLVFEEIRASCALAGALFEAAELRALIDGGVAAGSKPLASYLIAAGYAEAAQWVNNADPARPGRPFIRLEEVRELHARALRLQPEFRPGAYRTTMVSPLSSGMVPPPYWLVPREMAALGERLAAGPPHGGSLLTWLADVHERFHRIRPFIGGNGRVARLLTNLALRRLGLPPFVIHAAQARRYRRALVSADARDLGRLALGIGRSVLAGLDRLSDPGSPERGLQPLSHLAPPAERGALYKAAQRGRLRSVRRGGTLYSSVEWVRAYRASRSAAGAPPGKRGSEH